jgi:hypothetical protein
MGKVFTSLAVSVDGFITGHNPGPGHGLGDGGVPFGWYGDGDTPSQLFPGFRLFEPSRSVFDDLAGRARTRRLRSSWSATARCHPRRRTSRPSSPPSRPASRALAPLLAIGTSRSRAELPTHIGLSLVEAVPAPGATHLRYRIEK